MREIIAITQVSLDGVMQGPGGPQEDTSNGFIHGGWAMSFFDEAARKVTEKTIADSFDLLLGRRTYDIFASYWPHHGDDPIGKAFNSARKYVATRTLDRLEWENSYAIGARDVVEDLRDIKSKDGPPIHIWGSSNLHETLLDASLVDEYRLWICPVILGEGKRLFANTASPHSLSLSSTEHSPSGIVYNTYRRR